MIGLTRAARHLRRYRHIVGVLSKYGLAEVASRFKRSPSADGSRAVRAATDEPRTRPERFRGALEELGPTFVKFGQLLSTRPDLLPLEYTEELQRLQDEVRPVPWGQIRRTLESELGGRLDDHFQRIERAPIAAASIAQVHQAVTHEGNIVAIKILRPGVAEDIEVECEILEDLARLLKSTLSPEETIDPTRLVEELTEAVGKEVHLTNELRNLQRFQRNFQDDPTVHVPQAFPKYCTDRVLTMEYVEGIKPRNWERLVEAGLDPDVIAERGADFVLRQIFDFGVFHTDPHPANLLAMDGNVVAVLDFGQIARLGSSLQGLVGELVLAIVEQDADRLVRGFEQRDMLSDRTDVQHLTAEMEEMLDIYHSLPVKDIPFGRMMGQTFELIRRHHVRPPAEFSLMLKSLMTIESLAKGLNSDFQLIERLGPYARRLSMEQMDPRRLLRRTRRAAKDAIELAGRLPGDLSMIVSKFRRGDFQMHIQHEHLDSLVRTLDKSSNRVSFALIIAALLIASSMLVAQQGDILGIVGYQSLGVFGYLFAAVLGIWLVIGILRSRHF